MEIEISEKQLTPTRALMVVKGRLNAVSAP